MKKTIQFLGKTLNLSHERGRLFNYCYFYSENDLTLTVDGEIRNYYCNVRYKDSNILCIWDKTVKSMEKYAINQIKLISDGMAKLL